MDQILTQKWLLLEHIKDSSFNLTFVKVFSITEIGHTAPLPFWLSIDKNFQIFCLPGGRFLECFEKYVFGKLEV
jgi:hypothetical protein